MSSAFVHRLPVRYSACDLKRGGFDANDFTHFDIAPTGLWRKGSVPTRNVVVEVRQVFVDTATRRQNPITEAVRRRFEPGLCEPGGEGAPFERHAAAGP